MSLWHIINPLALIKYFILNNIFAFALKAALIHLSPIIIQIGKDQHNIPPNNRPHIKVRTKHLPCPKINPHQPMGYPITPFPLNNQIQILFLPILLGVCYGFRVEVDRTRKRLGGQDFLDFGVGLGGVGVGVALEGDGEGVLLLCGFWGQGGFGLLEDLGAWGAQGVGC